MKKANYKGFCLHVEEYDKLGIPYSLNDLKRLAKKYNTPIPKYLKMKIIDEKFWLKKMNKIKKLKKQREMLINNISTIQSAIEKINKKLFKLIVK